MTDPRKQPEAHADRHAEGKTAPDVPLVAPPVDEHLTGGKHVNVHLGPYAGMRLIIPAAEADQAIADHWATEITGEPFDQTAPLPPNLTPEERQAAEASAQAWYDVQQENANPKDKDQDRDRDPDPHDPAPRRRPAPPPPATPPTRDMEPAPHGDRYRTK